MLSHCFSLIVTSMSFIRCFQMIWLETPTNPNLKIADIAEISKIVKQYNKDILVVVDNTFLTSYLQRPLDHGADIVMYSITKYMNGHSDVIMGAAVLNDSDIEKKLRFLQNGKTVLLYLLSSYVYGEEHGVVAKNSHKWDSVRSPLTPLWRSGHLRSALRGRRVIALHIP